MFGFKKNKQQTMATAAKPEVEPKQGFFARLKQGLSKTRNNFTAGLGELFLGKKQIDDEVLEELETLLLTADVGVEATQKLVEDITERHNRKQLKDGEALLQALEEDMINMLQPCNAPLEIAADKKPYVILMVGVNGVGKTTTIGKLAQKFKNDGKQVMLAAGDTFRAAAVEQLQVWGERNDVPVVAQHSGADSAAVIFDALQAAKARGADILIADTAGRLHTQKNLMEELRKIKRVMSKLDEHAPHEVMLVVDAGTGQNALSQASLFNDAVQLTGITLTKLDGTAKGGIVFALAEKIGIPIRFIGVGESLDDLRPFEADEFVRALLSQD
jgi:fused signal recognition particle receptor